MISADLAAGRIASDRLALPQRTGVGGFSSAADLGGRLPWAASIASTPGRGQGSSSVLGGLPEPRQGMVGVAYGALIARLPLGPSSARSVAAAAPSARSLDEVVAV
jgi:hypothetical protein